MCQMARGACKNIGVMSLYHSPDAICIGTAPKEKVNLSPNGPENDWTAQIATLITRIVNTIGALARRAERTFGALFAASATHSGQCWPTDAGMAQRPQIGRSHRVHLSRVGVSLCA